MTTAASHATTHDDTAQNLRIKKHAYNYQGALSNREKVPQESAAEKMASPENRHSCMNIAALQFHCQASITHKTLFNHLF